MGERINLRKLYELEVRKQYQIEISNRFGALENLNGSKDINRAWENIKDNIKTSAKLVCMNESSINHGWAKNVHDF